MIETNLRWSMVDDRWPAGIMAAAAKVAAAALATALATAPAGADAQDDRRDDEMFGEEPGPDAELSASSIDRLERDRLQIGGLVYMRYMAQLYEGDEADPSMASPNLVEVYLDARPNDRLRAYVRGRLTYDPVTGSMFPLAPDIPQGLLDLMEAADSADPPGGSQQQADTVLDQLWIKFDVGRFLFVTAGKQPIKWGTTRLWNPVDFVNKARRDPLALYDERTGVTALKLHFPIESLSQNVIAVLLLDQADRVDKAGAALRYEAVFSTVELGLTGLVRKAPESAGSAGSPWAPTRDGRRFVQDEAPVEESVVPRFGLDVSAGVWDFDLAGEVGVSLVKDVDNDDTTGPVDGLDGEGGNDANNDKRKAQVQASAGLNYTLKYSDEDSLLVGGEYFYNPDGVGSSDAVFDALSAGTFVPFYFGRHYAAGYVAVPGPGSWDYTSFSASLVGNLSDGSYLARLDCSTAVLTFMTLEVYGAVNLGDKGGEFRFGIERGELFDGSPGWPFQEALLGVNLRMDI